MLVLLLAAVVGCQSIGYYKQAISGQLEMLSNQQPIPALIENTNTSPKLKEKFRLILALRQFAQTKLNLPTGSHYLAYVDLHRSNAVWNVYAAPEFSLKPISWWFPVVGSVTYRGYFSESAAQRYATKMRKKGLDVYVGGVDAYSTLGWFNDPVLNTFIDDSERHLASLIFHELTHQRLFISGDTDFNEALATAVAEEGLRRWLNEQKDPVVLQKYQVELKRKKQFLNLVRATRDRLEAIYGDTGSATQETNQQREQKISILTNLREDYAKLKQEWDGYSGFDDWFDGPLNNAQLSTVATYYDLVPAFHQLIHEDGGDLNRFFEHSKRFARMSKEQRHRTLAQVKVNRTNEFFASPEPPKKAADRAM